MNKLLLLTLLASSVALTPACSVADPILTAIIESDYDKLSSALHVTMLTQDQKDHYLNLADQMINARQDWMVKHAYHPQIGKDLVIAGLSSIVAAIGLTFVNPNEAPVIVFSPATLGATLYRLPKIVRGSDFSNQTIAGASVATVAAYVAITKLIAAYQKPKQLLANAIRIQDALYNA